MRQVLAWGVTLAAVTTSVAGEAQAQRPIATWEARVAPLDSGSGYLTYPVARTGMTDVPVSGSGWRCVALAPVIKPGLERVSVVCATASGHTASQTVECRAGGEASVSSMNIGAPGDGPKYIVAIACFPVPPPSPPPPKPIEKSL